MDDLETLSDIDAETAARAAGCLTETVARRAIRDAVDESIAQLRLSSLATQINKVVARRLDQTDPCSRCKGRGYVAGKNRWIYKCRECQSYGRDIRAFLQSFGIEPITRPASVEEMK
jgi:tRNA(Ile2) C34 agmatinyltransferase TiaS